MNIKRVPLSDIHPDLLNANRHTERGHAMLRDSIAEHGFAEAGTLDKDGRIIGGNHRFEVAGDLLGSDEALVIEVDGKQPVFIQRNDIDLATPQGRRLAIALNRVAQVSIDFDPEALATIMGEGVSLDGLFYEGEIEDLMAGIDDWDSESGEGTDAEAQARQTLAERFIVPPFSVLDARQGYWQNRKRAWIALGINPGDGRNVTGKNVTSGKNSAMFKISGRDNDEKIETGGSTISEFDPVLAECLYRWFCPPGGHIINPTAGESVYGIVAGVLGRTYQGVEIRAEQITENEQQAIDIGVSDKVKWIHGDGRNTGELVDKADFIINCPPYHDLEVYSEDPADISTIDDYNDFIEVYRGIVASAVSALKDNRFASVVVGDIRGKDGNYRNFVSDTISAFLAAGCTLYNSAVLIRAIGSIPLRSSYVFPKTRKLLPGHENVLIFLKGNSKEAVKACGDVEVSFLDGFGENFDSDN